MPRQCKKKNPEDMKYSDFMHVSDEFSIDKKRYK